MSVELEEKRLLWVGDGDGYGDRIRNRARLRAKVPLWQFGPHIV